MNILFETSLKICCLLTLLVGGITLTFEILVMPALKKLNNRQFLKVFKAIDKIIQDGHPIFMIVWIGSILTLLISTLLAWTSTSIMTSSILSVLFIICLMGVHIPTVTKNIPINLRCQQCDIDHASSSDIEDLHKDFIDIWLPWNKTRTIISLLVGVVILLVL
jgi:uncharacterized membrane protein